MQELYDLLAHSSLNNFLSKIDYSCDKCVFPHENLNHGHLNKLDILEINREKEFIYSVHLSYPFHGEFLLVWVTKSWEFDKIVWVYQDFIGRGEIELSGNCLADVEDWIRFQTFLPDLDYAPSNIIAKMTEDEYPLKLRIASKTKDKE